MAFVRWMRVLLIAVPLLTVLACAGPGDSTEQSDQSSDTSAPDLADATPGVDQLSADQSDSSELSSKDLGSDSTLTETDSGVQEIPGTMVYWNWPANGQFDHSTFFDYPWPESRRYDQDGTLALKGFPHPDPNFTDCPKFGGNEFYLDLIFKFLTARQFRQYVIDTTDKHTKSFGNNSAIFMRFTGKLSLNNLPDPAQSLDQFANLFLMDVDPKSPNRGERIPVSVKLYESTRYLKDYTLSVIPFPGFPLRPNTQYALVVLRSLKDASGNLLGVPLAFQQLKSKNHDGSTQAFLYAGVLDYLQTKVIKREDIAAMTVFTTGDPLADMRTIALKTEALEPTWADVKVDKVSWDKGKKIVVIEGSFNTTIWQQNDPPYLPNIDVANLTLNLDPDFTDGRVLADKSIQTSNTPAKSLPRLERIPFVLTIPQSTFKFDQPQKLDLTNVPLVLYGHGTGGSRTSVLSRVAAKMSDLGIATFAIDQVMHRGRGHSENLADIGVANLGLEEITEKGTLFFNPLNLHAGVGNVLQSGADYVWQARFLVASTIAFQLTADHDGKPETADVTLLRTVTFDPAKLYFFGHSQGGLVGPLAATSRFIKGMVLSAPGGHLIHSLLSKIKPEKPIPIKKVIEYIVCDSEAPTIHHPLMSVFMTLFEPVDGVNYARLINREPGKYGAKHLFITQGTTDSYATPPTNHALTTAGRLWQVGPVLLDVPGQALLGLDPRVVPLSGNVEFGGKKFTSGFKQYHGALPACKDDHYVYTCVPRATQDWVNFFKTMIETDLPVIDPGPFD